MKIQIAPSILNADFLNLRQALDSVKEADWIHLDIMDGHFVPNISFGTPVVKAVCEGTKIPAEAHLMVMEPEKFVEWMLPLGVKRIIVHVETTFHLHRLLSRIREAGIKAGVAVNPGTGLENIMYCLPLIDMVLFMTVNPGFGGQTFISDVLPKIREFKKASQKKGYSVPVEVDGGINQETALKVIEAGAEILVMGTTIFQQKEREKYIREVKKVFS